MFENLSERLSGVFDRLTKQGALSDKEISTALREVRVALLEADVSLSVARDFIKSVEIKAKGQTVTKSVTPGQQVVKIVHDELVGILSGTETYESDLRIDNPPAPILMVGLQGSGKTTTTAKIAKRLKSKNGKKVLMASLDTNRPAAMEQLAILGGQLNIDTLPIVNGQKSVEIAKPDYVFHLAAQSLVKKSYQNPLFTYYTNAIGTLNVMESLISLRNNCIAVIITSDKSYKNLEIERGYKETDVLGGADPYSASKASAELIIQSYFKSYLNDKKNIRIAVARAGNVIGGGDWSEDRLIPDCVRSWSKNEKVIIRNPDSTRPWQHVLDALYGYITLSINLRKNIKLNGQAFNFGPSMNNNYKVIDVLKLVKKLWQNILWKIIKVKKREFESSLLKLNSSKANSILKWRCNLSFKESIYFTTEWYKYFYTKKKNMYDFSTKQINLYVKRLK